MEVLFGKDYELTPKTDLVEENSFVAEERVKLVGLKGEFERVAIIAPFRNQVLSHLNLSGLWM
ncbi:propanediol utilization protein [Desulfitispora alkaliphila]